jgi:hypothetical protein
MNEILINPLFNGKFTFNEILLNTATLQTIIEWNPSQTEGYFFKATSENYSFCAGVRNKMIYLERNSKSCELELPNWIIGKNIFLVFIWKPSGLSITVMRSDENDDVKTFKNELTTVPTECPSDLRTWAREQQLIKRHSFDTEEELYRTCITSLQNIRAKLLQSNSYYSAWNTNKKPYEPKKETEVQPFLNILISDELFLNGIEIFPEVLTGTGQIDFLMSGYVKERGIKSICVEVKNAHNDIKHGVTSQLVNYMATKNAKYGIFCILYYKGDWFDEPNSFNDITEMELDLDRHRIGSEDYLKQENIKIVTIDLTKPKTASQKK